MYMLTQYKGIPDNFVVPLNFANFGEEALEKQIVIDGCLPHRCYGIEIEIEIMNWSFRGSEFLSPF